ncbi:unnamed protein product [Bursaphelenchus xylophilus]|uniref:(pine wood nematode) hypothetical protein n=1 Tax=Bursaphelenchus xylophilus TaxID=6326 RepID=A0A1I7S257_BURXY|nr:unnamed protein product [Bursaphelenchus xylophilus]CAG9114889.1 unnamed protein product [Bursaphelenchus xylophilus]
MVGVESIVEVQLDDRVCRLNPTNQQHVLEPSPSLFIAKPREKLKVRRPVTKECHSNLEDVKMPEDYYVFTGNEFETSENSVEYDVEDVDVEWLRLVNDKRAKDKLKPLTEDEVEKAIDRFEKASHFQSEHRPPQVDDDAPCCICNEAEDANTNQIIFCDMCNIAVHQECYGVPYIPAGQWLCRKCQLSPSQPVQCELCPFKDGAFKQTADGKWVHVVCALWLSEVHFANVVFLEPVEGVKNSLKRRAKLTCQVCRIKHGACLQCSKKCCVRPFHVTCAIFSEMLMEVRQSEKDGSEDTVVERFVYCHQHSAAKAKVDIHSSSFKRLVSEKLKRARRALQNSSKQINNLVLPVVPRSQFDDIKSELKVDRPEDLLHFWFLKRRARCGVPLLRRLQVYHSKKQVGRRSGEGLLDEITAAGRDSSQWDQLLRTGKLRNNLEKLRLLVELVKKREKIKLETIQNYRDIVENALKSIRTILEETLERLVERDHLHVFTQPVNEAEVPGYSNIIKKPIDFGKMYKKLENGDYRRVADLKADFDLMMSNCESFNRNNEHFLRYGQIIKSLGSKILKEAEAEVELTASPKMLCELPFLFPECSKNENMQIINRANSIADMTNSKPLERRSSTASVKSSRKALNGLKRGRDTAQPKILDFFKPVVTPTTPSSPQSPPHKRARPRSPEKKSKVIRSRQDYFTETSSDTAGVSTDEDIGGMRRRLRRSNRSGRQSENDSDAVNGADFMHNDIVWAPMGREKMVGRIVKRTLVEFEEEKEIRDKIKQLRPSADPSMVPILFFDVNSTVQYVNYTDLSHCDVMKTPSADNQTLLAAFGRAKEYWEKTMRD